MRMLKSAGLALAIFAAAFVQHVSAQKIVLGLFGLYGVQHVIRCSERRYLQEARPRRRDEARAEFLDDAGSTRRRQPSGRDTHRADHAFRQSSRGSISWCSRAAATMRRGSRTSPSWCKPDSPIKIAKDFEGKARGNRGP